MQNGEARRHSSCSNFNRMSPPFPLIAFVRPYWKRAAAALLGLVLLVVIDLAIPRLIQRIIDQGIARHNTGGADHFILRLSQGYQTNLSERAANISQGRRQLLAIARAILADPAVLILDETTSSVDTRTEARIQKPLPALRKGRTSFVIAHRLSTIRDADRVVVVDQGAVVEEGTHRELLDKKGFYDHLYRS